MSSNDARTGEGMLLLATGTALAGGGVGALVGEPMATWALAAALPVAIALAILAVAWLSLATVERAALTVIVGPFALFLYAVWMSVAMRYAPAFGYALLALGLGAFGLAARSWVLGGSPRARERAVGTAGTEPGRHWEAASEARP